VFYWLHLNLNKSEGELIQPVSNAEVSIWFRNFNTQVTPVFAVCMAKTQISASGSMEYTVTDIVSTAEVIRKYCDMYNFRFYETAL
jgi:hypothetical protein